MSDRGGQHLGLENLAKTLICHNIPVLLVMSLLEK